MNSYAFFFEWSTLKISNVTMGLFFRRANDGVCDDVSWWTWDIFRWVWVWDSPCTMRRVLSPGVSYSRWWKLLFDWVNKVNFNFDWWCVLLICGCFAFFSFIGSVLCWLLKSGCRRITFLTFQLLLLLFLIQLKCLYQPRLLSSFGLLWKIYIRLS